MVAWLAQPPFKWIADVGSVVSLATATYARMVLKNPALN